MDQILHKKCLFTTPETKSDFVIVIGENRLNGKP